MPEKGYYGQYIYGNNHKILSPKSESLGEALCVLFNIATDKQKESIIANTPVTSFGLPCIFPQIQNIPAYHNNAVWPFVQSYWALAAAKAGNESSLLQSICAIYRPAAMFLTNKENFVVDNGDYKGTQINSSNMLWSLAGSIGLIHKIIFGISFHPDGLTFDPFVPQALKGNRSLQNFRYRKSILNIELEGHGNKIRSFSMDGKISDTAFIPANLTGTHNVKIILANNNPGGKVNEVENHVALETPAPSIKNNLLSWPEINGAAGYRIIKNGKPIARVNAPLFTATGTRYAGYQVIAVDEKGYESFASEPVITIQQNQVITYETEDIVSKAAFSYKGFSGKGFIEISKEKNTNLSIPVIIEADGVYSIDFKYANGNGPTNTENKCAIRTLKDGTTVLGTVIFPQRGNEEWSNWGYSNPVKATLKKGRHILKLSFEPANENMNGAINQAMLDYVRITRL